MTTPPLILPLPHLLNPRPHPLRPRLRKRREILRRHLHVPLPRLKQLKFAPAKHDPQIQKQLRHRKVLTQTGARATAKRYQVARQRLAGVRSDDGVLLLLITWLRGKPAVRVEGFGGGKDEGVAVLDVGTHAEGGVGGDGVFPECYGGVRVNALEALGYAI